MTAITEEKNLVVLQSVPKASSVLEAAALREGRLFLRGFEGMYSFDRLRRTLA